MNKSHYQNGLAITAGKVVKVMRSLDIVQMGAAERDASIMGQEADCLFIYGTLMAVSGHPMAARLTGESRVLGPATAGGRLYDLGAYPGAVPVDSQGDRIHGLIVKLAHPQLTLRWLDAYEGCEANDPEPCAFQRVIAQVRLMSGRQVDAWMYCYRGSLTKARRLPSGRYISRKSLVPLRS